LDLEVPEVNYLFKFINHRDELCNSHSFRQTSDFTDYPFINWHYTLENKLTINVTNDRQRGTFISLMDLHGRILHTFLRFGEQVETEINMNSSQFNAGLYILQIQSDFYTRHIKIYKPN